MTGTVVDAGASWVGKTLDDRYRVDRLLGEGGMGAVFVAHHLRLDKPVALKIILPEHAGNAELASRFAREAMLTAKIEHPHVVSAIDTGALPGGGAYLVMQLAKGKSLRAYVEPSTGWAMACEIGAQIADALSVAHGMGVVHRDLKPENVIVEERDGSLHCRVLDFGIARTTTTAGETPTEGKALTRIGTILGTPGYMPPEQALGDTVDHRADLYSLGVIVWEVAAGRPLFVGKDPREIALAQLTEPVPALAGDVPAGLVELLDALIQPKREDRPSSASEVRDRLKLLSGKTTSMRLAGVSGALAAIPPTNEMAKPDVARASTPLAANPIASTELAAPAAVPIGSVVKAPPSTSGAAPDRRRVLGILGGGSLLTAVAFFALDPVGLCAGPFDDVPEALRADVETIVTSDEPTRRVGAASRLDPHEAELPDFVDHVVDYELARTCDARRDAVRALRADGDARALPALERMRALPRTGCGRNDAGDCHACMRDDVEEAIVALGGTASGDDATATGEATEETAPAAEEETPAAAADEEEDTVDDAPAKTTRRRRAPRWRRRR